MNMNLRIKTASPVKSLAISGILALMVIYVILIAYPLFNMVMSSLKPTREILQHPFALPVNPDFSSYKRVWVDMGFSTFFVNSIIVTVSSMVLVLLFGSMASYAISRYAFKGNTLLYMIFLSGIMLPLKAAIIPLFMII